MTAAENYAARIDVVLRQRQRLAGDGQGRDRWAGPMARRFRADPRRPLDPNLDVIASYVQPGDLLVDVGGGAGRLSLPLAWRCQAVVNVDPSPGMCMEFEASAAEAKIANAGVVKSDWLLAGDVQGDVVLAANVTYFVREIVSFVEKLQTAARRLVIVAIASPPPPTQNAKLFELIHGEAQEPVPGQPELLPVLWEMGILPDVRMLPVPFLGLGGPSSTRDEAIEFAVQATASPDSAPARQTVEAHFDELFDTGPAGFVPRWRPRMREMLIMWRPDGSPVGR